MTTKDKVIGGILLGIVIITILVIAGMQSLMLYERFGSFFIIIATIMYIACSSFVFYAIRYKEKADNELAEAIIKATSDKTKI